MPPKKLISPTKKTLLNIFLFFTPFFFEFESIRLGIMDKIYYIPIPGALLNINGMFKLFHYFSEVCRGNTGNLICSPVINKYFAIYNNGSISKNRAKTQPLVFIFGFWFKNRVIKTRYYPCRVFKVKKRYSKPVFCIAGQAMINHKPAVFRLYRNSANSNLFIIPAIHSG